ncbi:hypothetical protein RA268_29165, partial [Pseudomonas syringae pv. tagetis]
MVVLLWGVVLGLVVAVVGGGCRWVVVVVGVFVVGGLCVGGVAVAGGVGGDVAWGCGWWVIV